MIQELFHLFYSLFSKKSFSYLDFQSSFPLVLTTSTGSGLKALRKKIYPIGSSCGATGIKGYGGNIMKNLFSSKKFLRIFLFNRTYPSTGLRTSGGNKDFCVKRDLKWVLNVCCLIVVFLNTNEITATPIDLVNSRIFVAGHTGLVGSAIMRRLEKEGCNHIITRTSQQLDLRNQAAVDAFFAAERPEYIFLAAAKVGGIKANMDYPAEFIYDNIMIEANVIHAAYKYGAKKLLFLGSSCIYPRNCPQPIKEEYLLSSELEKTNEPYAVAKIAGIKMCQSYNRQYGTKFIACMPTNLYGPNDNFDLNNSHVLPALLRKIYDAKKNNQPTVTIWGSGTPYREFLHVDDLADGVIFLMKQYEGNEIVNIGTGTDVTIAQLAQIIAKETGFAGQLVFDRTKPDGTPRKLLNVDVLKNLGWQAKINLQDGIHNTVQWCIKELRW